jgi:hypothetical protein
MFVVANHLLVKRRNPNSITLIGLNSRTVNSFRVQLILPEGVRDLAAALGSSTRLPCPTWVEAHRICDIVIA